MTDDPRDLVWIEDPGQGAHSLERDLVPAGAAACSARLCKPDDHATVLLGSLFLSSPQAEHRTGVSYERGTPAELSGGIMWRRKRERGYQA